MSEAYYIRELTPFGIDTTRAFRALCRSICCPTIVLGRTAFVDPSVFQVCMKHLSMPGNKDFHGPNSYQKDKKNRRHFRNRVEPDEIQRNWKLVVRSILDSRRMVGLHSPPTERAAIRSAAAELTRFVLTMIPAAEQTNGKKEPNQEADARAGTPGIACPVEEPAFDVSGCGRDAAPHEAGGPGPHRPRACCGDGDSGQEVEGKEHPVCG
jgi:hypothetical protein